MRVFVIAGEPSGDKLGQAVMAALRSLVPGIIFDGIGGPLMTGEGLRSRFPMDELSVMGIAEVLPKYFHLKRRIAETAQAVIDNPPDILLTIDSPDFCLRVAKLVKAATRVRTVHYVAPTVWAWRPGRAVKMAKVIDHVLALLPFEPPYMQAAGMDCDFVGHPVVAEPTATEAEALAFRTNYGIGNAPLILTLPGSRRGEVTRLSDRFAIALRVVLAEHPNARIVVPAASAVTGLVGEAIKDWPGPPILIDPATDPDGQIKRAAFRAADIALAASGTVSLELAASDTPMVIAYDMAWLSRQIIPRLLLVDSVNLVNLVTETRTVPEFIGNACLAEPIALALNAVMTNPDAQRPALRLTMERLGQGGEPPGGRAAKAILARMPSLAGKTA